MSVVVARSGCCRLFLRDGHVRVDFFCEELAEAPWLRAFLSRKELESSLAGRDVLEAGFSGMVFIICAVLDMQNSPV